MAAAVPTGGATTAAGGARSLPALPHPFSPGQVVLLAIAPDTLPAGLSELQRTLVAKRHDVVQDQQSLKTLGAYVTLLLALERGAYDPGEGRLATDPLLALPPSPYTLGDAALPVEGRGMGFELFMILGALARAYAQRGILQAGAGVGDKAKRAIKDLIQAQDMALAAVRVYTRHATRSGAFWPPALLVPAMSAVAQRVRAQMLGLQAQQVSAAYQLNGGADALAAGIMLHLVQTYSSLSAAETEAGLRKQAQLLGHWWTARLAAALATTTPPPSGRRAKRLWALCESATLRCGPHPSGAALLGMARLEQQKRAHEELHGMIEVHEDGEEAEGGDEEEGDILGGVVAQPQTLPASELLGEWRTAGDAWVVSQGGLAKLMAGAAAASPLPSLLDLTGVASAPPAPSEDQLLSTLLGVAPSHAMLKHPLAASPYVRSLAIALTLAERQRRLEHGNEPEMLESVSRQFVEMCKTDSYWSA